MFVCFNKLGDGIKIMLHRSTVHFNVREIKNQF